MQEIQARNTYKTSDVTNAKNRKGFWSNLFGRSSRPSQGDKQKDDHKGGLMNSLMDNARQAAVKEVGDVAKDETMHEIEALMSKNNNGGSQSTDPTTATANMEPDTTTTTTTPSDAVSESTNWIKRMADTAQKRVQGLQNSVGA